MNTMAELVLGVDTHLDVHVAALVERSGRTRATGSFRNDPDGFERLMAWCVDHGTIAQAGVEGTSSYGMALARFLARHGVVVFEVNRPDRQRRRRKGKSDTVDAESAARAVLSGDATAVPKSHDGPVESLRALKIARDATEKTCTQLANQLRMLAVTAPDELAGQLRHPKLTDLVEACLALDEPRDVATAVGGHTLSLRLLAQRWQRLDAERRMLDRSLDQLTKKIAPRTRALKGVGKDVAATLLLTAGDNPQRITSEAAFAACCGASPVEASSGRTQRHRLNRGGDRQANCALWWIAITRLRCCETTKAYEKRRTEQGHSRREIIRCLKRYAAREVYRALITDLANLTP